MTATAVTSSRGQDSRCSPASAWCSSDLDGDLAEVTARGEVLVSFARLVEGESPIDHRVDFGGTHHTVQVLEHLATADEDADKSLGSRDQRHIFHLGAPAAQPADDRDHSTHPGGGQ